MQELEDLKLKIFTPASKSVTLDNVKLRELTKKREEKNRLIALRLKTPVTSKLAFSHAFKANEDEVVQIALTRKKLMMDKFFPEKG